MKIHDVIIIGGGPIGSFVAQLLASEGLEVVLLEKKSAIGEDVNCTGIISTECFERFNLPQNTIIKPLKVIKIFSPSGYSIVYDAPSPFAYVVERSIFDFEINRIALKKGAILYLETKAERIEITDEAFKVRVKIRGEEAELSSRVGVIATGFELNFLGALFNRTQDFLYGVQTNVKINSCKDVKIYLGNRIAPGSFAWVVPTNGNSAKIGLISDKNSVIYLKNFLKHPFIANKLNDGHNNYIKCSPIPLGRIPKSYGERFVIVGEAAGQVKTTTGGGIYFGFLGAEIAAQTIIRAFERDDFSEKMFKEYELRWREKIEPELKAGIYLRKIFSRFSDAQIDKLINFVGKNGILPALKEKTKFDWHKDLITSLFQHLFFKKFFRI